MFYSKDGLLSRKDGLFYTFTFLQLTAIECFRKYKIFSLKWCISPTSFLEIIGKIVILNNHYVPNDITMLPTGEWYFATMLHRLSYWKGVWEKLATATLQKGLGNPILVAKIWKTHYSTSPVVDCKSWIG